MSPTSKFSICVSKTLKKDKAFKISKNSHYSLLYYIPALVVFIYSLEALIPLATFYRLLKGGIEIDYSLTTLFVFRRVRLL